MAGTHTVHAATAVCLCGGGDRGVGLCRGGCGGSVGVQVEVACGKV